MHIHTMLVTVLVTISVALSDTVGYFPDLGSDQKVGSYSVRIKFLALKFSLFLLLYRYFCTIASEAYGTGTGYR